MALIDEIGPGPVALDTAVFIYFAEENARYLPIVDPLFHAIDQRRLRAFTSALTLLEVLVVPYRAGNHVLVQRYEALLAGSRGLTMMELKFDVLRTAAQLRAAVGVKTPDALQLATAFQGGCTSFVTNDRSLPELPGLRILQLSDFPR